MSAFSRSSSWRADPPAEDGDGRRRRHRHPQHGLIDPVRTSGGDRRYSQNDLYRLGRINQLSGSGISLDAVKQIIELQDDNARLRAELETLRAHLDQA